MSAAAIYSFREESGTGWGIAAGMIDPLGGLMAIQWHARPISNYRNIL